jgi:hypothetical protein
MKSLLRLIALLLASQLLARERFELIREEDGTVVKVGGELFTKYNHLFQNKTVLYPIIGPTGKAMTRELDSGGDHIHHASMWFTHGDVNKVDFWHFGGLIEHKEYLEATGGDTAVLKTSSIWNDGDKMAIGEEVRWMEFGEACGKRWIDFDITFTALAPVSFGKTKEGSFGVRVRPDMTVDKGGGTILNSSGQKDKGAWSKAAKWVDYTAKIEGETIGVAIFNHPDSFRHPTPWHVRTYGLFCANPFMHVGLDLKEGQSFRMKHKIVFHSGTTEDAGIAALYAEYAK